MVEESSTSTGGGDKLRSVAGTESESDNGRPHGDSNDNNDVKVLNVASAPSVPECDAVQSLGPPVHQWSNGHAFRHQATVEFVNL